MRKDLQRIAVKGGVLSPSELKQIVELLEFIGLDYLHFGSRQDILFPCPDAQKKYFAQFPNIDIKEISAREYHNIVSSYVASDIFSSTPWLMGTTYLYVLEQLPSSAKLRINITDPRQRLVPLFTGQLNFIASSLEDYWYLYVRLYKDDTLHRFPTLIHTWDIGKVTHCIMDYYEDATTTYDLFQFVCEETDTNSRTIHQDLILPFHPFPYYEGMNKLGIDHYWLGLYWRNNRYDLKFLKTMCDLCLDHKIGKICVTPWKSFIVKGIHKNFKLAWEKFLGKFGINVRHSLLEMNWHLPVNNEEALELKRFLVRNFDQNDISTYGLTFGIRSDYGLDFTSILIEKNPMPQVTINFNVRPTYNVLHAKNFDPNTLEYITYAQDVDKIELPGLLMELSRLYFEQLGQIEVVNERNTSLEKIQQEEASQAFQCINCLTVYDSRFGDKFSKIPSGTPFDHLQEDYCCPTCGTGKQRFRLVEQILG